MSRENSCGSDDMFQKELAQLRLEIDSLPSGKRPHLHELADAVERRHLYTRTLAEKVKVPASHVSSTT